MKKILMIGTGGTIASEKTPKGLAPDLDPAGLLRYVPAVREMCEVDCLSLFSIDSTNITPSHWVTMTRTVREHYAEYDGFVISHGTDTMAYTAAALSYMLQDLDKPVVLTGSQRPVNDDSTDSKMNLTDAFVCACDERLSGVCIVFSGRVILGTRARKTCSKSFTAFSSINYPDLAILLDHRLIRYIEPERGGEPRFFDELCEKVGLVKMVPGMDPALWEWMLEHYKALVVECFGVGGLPSYGNTAFLELVDRYTAMGRFVVMTTQVQNEGSDLSVYSVGHDLKENPYILEAYDMTSESAYAKLMWILAQTRDVDEVNRLFYTPVAHDILQGGV